MGHNVYNIKRILKRRIDYYKRNERQYLEKYIDSIYLAYTHFYRDIEGMDRRCSKTKAEEKIVENKNKIVIPRLVVNVTDRCTLKCKECSGLVPYLNRREEADVELIIGDLNKIFNIIDECICLEFIGGEPLLYNKLGMLLQYGQNNNKVKMIEITTNATILPTQELMQILINKKTLVQISEYKQISIQKMEEMEKLLKKNNVKYKILEMERWFSYGNAEKRGKSRKKLKYNYYYCNENKMCRTLYDGKLFVCGRAAALYAMGKLVDDSSYLDIRKKRKITGEDLVNYYINKTYAEACDFCDIANDNLKSVVVAEQIVSEMTGKKGTRK